MQYQDLTPAKQGIDIYLKSHPRAKLTTLYKHIRAFQSLSMIGDWPLVYEICHRAKKQKIFFTKKDVAKTLRQTEDPFLNKLRVDSELVAYLTNKDNF